MLSRGVPPDLARAWLERCYPAQIDRVLNNPQWQKYSGAELAEIGMRGARGFRREWNKAKKELLQLEHETRIAANLRARAEREQNTRAGRQQQAQATQSLLDDYL